MDVNMPKDSNENDHLNDMSRDNDTFQGYSFLQMDDGNIM